MSLVEPSPAEPGPRRDLRRIVDAACGILEQGENLLESVTPAQYAQPVPEVFDGSIGGHYRHCLDHLESVLRGLGGGDVDYDHRRRDPEQESQPGVALEATRDLRRRISRLTPELLEAPVTARCKVGYSPGASPGTRTSVGREIAFCVSHAIHHYALIAVIARRLGVSLPSGFGVAPSTLDHRNGTPS